MEIEILHNEYIIGFYDYPIVIIGIPSILATILANETLNSVSVAKHEPTDFKRDPKEQFLYDKWVNKINDLVIRSSSAVSKKRAMKIARENAGYLTSVFAPITIEYKVNISQLSYVVNRCVKFLHGDNPGVSIAFFKKLRPFVIEFVSGMRAIFKNRIDSNKKDGNFKFFNNRVLNGNVYCGEVFNRTSLMSLNCLTHMRLREYSEGLEYAVTIPNELYYFTPPIIAQFAKDNGGRIIDDWQNDISSLSNLFPCGILANVSESGSCTNFIRKISKMLNRPASVLSEASMNTCISLQIYLEMTKLLRDKGTFLALEAKNDKIRKITGCECSDPCLWSGHTDWIKWKDKF